MDILERRLKGTMNLALAACFIATIVIGILVLSYIGYDCILETLRSEGEILYVMILASATINTGVIVLIVTMIYTSYSPIKDLIKEGLRLIKSSRISKSKEIVPYVVEPEVVEEDPNILFNKVIYSQTQELLSILKKGYPF